MLFFIDESGHPHPNDAATRPVLLAVGIPVTRSRDLTRQVYNLKRGLWGDVDPMKEEKYKAAAIFNRGTMERYPAKWQYLEGLFEIAVNFPVVTLAIVMERPSIPLVQGDLIPYYWRLLIQRIDAYVAQNATDRHALVVMDSQNHKSDATLSMQIANYLFRSNQGRRLQNVVETPLFVDSKITPGIQIADVFASAFRQYHQMKDIGQINSTDPYGVAVGRLYRSAKRTIYDHTDVDGTTWYGEYFLPAERLERHINHVETSEPGEPEVT